MEKYDIISVAKALNMTLLKDDSRSEVPVVCPFCGDKRGKMSLRREKQGKPANVYHCWHCGEAGNMYDLFEQLSGVTIGDGDIRQLLDDYMTNGCRITISVAKEQHHEKKAAISRIASAKIRNKTYRAMLSMLSLRENDKKDLLRRGLTDEQVDAGMFASTPKDNIGICRKLIKAGCQLDGVPGFYINRRGDWALNVYDSISGYFCPVVQEGNVLGCQIRLNAPKDNRKYIWLTSADKDHGCSSGSPASSWGNPDSDHVIITEGILKSYVTYCLSGASIIGVPGVEAIKDVPYILNRHCHKVVYEAYYMEKRDPSICHMDYDKNKCEKCKEEGFKNRKNNGCDRKYQRRKKLEKSIEKLKKSVEKCGLPMKQYLWSLNNFGFWNGSNKGIDDELLARIKSREGQNGRN